MLSEGERLGPSELGLLAAVGVTMYVPDSATSGSGSTRIRQYSSVLGMIHVQNV